MKVALITLMDDSNLGNRLQNFASQELLKQRGHDVTSLYFSFNYYKGISCVKWNIHDLLLKTNIRSCKYYLKIFKRDKKQIRGLGFTKEFIKTSSKYLYKFKYHKMSKHKNDFDMWCIGSDQIWCYDTVRNNSELFLMFVEPDKTFSLSSSFGNVKIDRIYNDTFIKGLNHIKNISVREDEAAELVYKLTNRKVDILLDPTMLINEHCWIEICKRPLLSINSSYILVYFLGGMSESLKNNIELYAESKGYSIIDVENSNPVIGPREFIWLVNNATFVFTDSFHGCAFSILFRKKFGAFNRKNYGYDMSSRINTVLKRFDMMDNKFNDSFMDLSEFNAFVKCIEDKSVDYITDILEFERNSANIFLNKALGE